MKRIRTAVVPLTAAGAAVFSGEVGMPGFHFVFDGNETARSAEIEQCVRSGVKTVEDFFGRPFPGDAAVIVCPDREAFDGELPVEWGITPTQDWMVAVGVADRLVLLSPEAWDGQASEHDPEDAAHIQEIVTHELVHVYHGQHNPTGDFTGAEELGWFIEGLAVLVSGQLAGDHSGDAREAIESGSVPESLSEAWSGRYRYGVCGSMVSFLDSRLGREVLFSMLKAVSQEEILITAGLSEREFLMAWSGFAGEEY